MGLAAFMAMHTGAETDSLSLRTAHVGLLTYAFRRCRQCAPSAFSPSHYRNSNDPLSQSVSRRTKEHSAITATKPILHHRSLTGAFLDTCPGFSPNSLVQRTRYACPVVSFSRRVAHLPQKHVSLYELGIYHIIHIMW